MALNLRLLAKGVSSNKGDFPGGPVAKIPSSQRKLPSVVRELDPTGYN